MVFFFVFFLGQDHLSPEAEEITMISIQLAARFLFTTGFHTKKIVRGSASDWYLVLDFYFCLRFGGGLCRVLCIFFSESQDFYSNLRGNI